MRARPVLLLAAFVTSAADACGGGTATGGSGARLSEGTWGGDHVRLEVTAAGGTLDYDCAHGTIDEPLVLDAESRFVAKGRHVRESGGPQREDETSAAEPARYTGRVEGDTMTLTVTLERGEEVGRFTLTRGTAGRVFKCL